VFVDHTAGRANGRRRGLVPLAIRIVDDLFNQSIFAMVFMTSY
jgi:hypothetical protein